MCDQQDAALTDLTGERRETLELERRKDARRYGEWPFEIGLWVGKAGTPNRLGERGDSRSDSARSKVSQYKNNPQGKPAPIPLESCPWCGEDFTPDSFTLLPNSDHPTELRIACANWECDFSGDTPLPIVAVDSRSTVACLPLWSPRWTSSRDFVMLHAPPVRRCSRSWR